MRRPARLRWEGETSTTSSGAVAGSVLVSNGHCWYVRALARSPNGDWSSGPLAWSGADTAPDLVLHSKQYHSSLTVCFPAPLLPHSPSTGGAGRVPRVSPYPSFRLCLLSFSSPFFPL